MVRSAPRSHEELVEQLYEAAYDPGRWPIILDELASQSDSLCATLFTWNSQRDRLGALHAGTSYYGNDLYRARYADLDPRRKLTQRLQAGALFRCHQQIEDDFVRRDPFYQEFSLPHERRFLMSTHLLKTEEMSCFAVLHRAARQGPFSEDDAKRFLRLMPHLRRVILLQEKLAAAETGFRVSEDALSKLPFAIILVDHMGRVIQANSAAEAMVRANDGVSIRNGYLALRDANGMRALTASVQEATQAALSGVGRQGASLVALRPSQRKGYHILIAPMSERQHALLGSQRLALVLISDPERTSVSSERHLSTMLGLTKAEAQIALALCAGKSVDEISNERGVTAMTVRSQIKIILKKQIAGGSLISCGEF